MFKHKTNLEIEVDEDVRAKIRKKVMESPVTRRKNIQKLVINESNNNLRL